MDLVLPGDLAEAFQGVDARWASVDVVAFHRLVSQRWAEVALVVDDDEGVVLVGDVPAGVEVRCHGDQMVELLTPRRREAR
jgi:hypothetical protein